MYERNSFLPTVFSQHYYPNPNHNHNPNPDSNRVLGPGLYNHNTKALTLAVRLRMGTEIGDGG